LIKQIATQPSVFDSEQSEEYQKILINPEWENFEAFDPSFRWTWREERKVRRIIDFKIMVSTAIPPVCAFDSSLTGQGWVAVMFFALNIDRGNLSNAVSDNMLDDLKLTQADYVSSPMHLAKLLADLSELGQHTGETGFPGCRASLTADIETPRAGSLDPHPDLLLQLHLGYAVLPDWSRLFPRHSILDVGIPPACHSRS
jgi:hypothetical protein